MGLYRAGMPCSPKEQGHDDSSLQLILQLRVERQASAGGPGETAGREEEGGSFDVVEVHLVEVHVVEHAIEGCRRRRRSPLQPAGAIRGSHHGAASADCRAQRTLGCRRCDRLAGGGHLRSSPGLVADFVSRRVS